MEIRSPGRVEAASSRRVSKGTTGGEQTFSVSGASDPRPQAVAAPGPLTALDSILTLQGMDDSLSGRSKGLAHGEHLLDMLDQVRDGLLAGGIPRSTLNRLAVAVGRRHESFADPKLQSVLDEIELRAHVELAKLEMMDKRVA
ncbi:MAG: flagellar assembly protein FliX [Alphaproteobacteria bacterium]|nr:flagellar assembly protein FliX [Alphaproteobacteria bacterium]